MDDELNAARRCGALRKLLWPHGKKHKGFMHGKRWMGAALILLVCALTAVGIAVFNGGAKQPEQPVAVEKECNEGVLSLSDFLKMYADHFDILSAGPVHSLTRRLMNEPFEVSAQVTIESDSLKSLGIPLTSLPAELEIKYDLRDAGVKLSAVGLDVFDAYLTENELATASMGAEPEVTELPAGGDLSADMTLENRVGVFVPLPSEGLTDRLLDVLAQSVPAECTEQQLGRVYSPKDGQDVNVTLINTKLSGEALAEAAAAFAQLLEQDKALYDETQRLTAAAAAMAGAKDVTLDSLLTQLINQDYEGAVVSWNVYRRSDVPAGFSVRVITKSAQVDFIRMVEFDGETSYERTQLLIDETEVLCADAVITGEAGEFSAKAAGPDGETVSLSGTFELEKIAENTYHLTAEADAAGKLMSGNDDIVHMDIDARIDVGSGLGLMSDSPDWTKIKND